MGKLIYVLIQGKNMTNKKDKIIKYLITTLFILLPIIDMIRATSLKDIEILKILMKTG